MQFSTAVDITKSRYPIVYSDKILTLGSCFADQMAEKCRKYLFQITANPFGVLYNPFSIAYAIQAMANEDMNVPVVFHNGVYHSLCHHSVFSSGSQMELQNNVQQSIIEGHKALQEANVVIVTFGTAFVYALKNLSLLVNNHFNEPFVVANCHKLPPQNFDRYRMDVQEIVDLWQSILDYFPNKHWIFTVSPIRHLQDGLHENQLSKATLQLAIEQLMKKNTQRKISYFPAYEILLDELRDYRYYADDLLHPSSVAVEYVWEKFASTFMHTTEQTEMKRMNKLYLNTQHRPNIPNSAEQAKFQQMTQKLYNSLLPNHPWIQQTTPSFKPITTKIPQDATNEHFRQITNKIYRAIQPQPHQLTQPIPTYTAPRMVHQPITNVNYRPIDRHLPYEDRVKEVTRKLSKMLKINS